MKRCQWADPSSELYIAYHDNEWGQPEHDDRKLFEMLTLESFQAGLSWLTILKKREAFRMAFDGFQPDVVARECPEIAGKGTELLLNGEIYPGIADRSLNLTPVADDACISHQFLHLLRTIPTPPLS